MYLYILMVIAVSTLLSTLITYILHKKKIMSKNLSIAICISSIIISILFPFILSIFVTLKTSFINLWAFLFSLLIYFILLILATVLLEKLDIDKGLYNRVFKNKISGFDMDKIVSGPLANINLYDLDIKENFDKDKLYEEEYIENIEIQSELKQEYKLDQEVEKDIDIEPIIDKIGVDISNKLKSSFKNDSELIEVPVTEDEISALLYEDDILDSDVTIDDNSKGTDRSNYQRKVDRELQEVSNEEVQEEILQVSYKEVQEEILEVSNEEVQEEILEVSNEEAQEEILEVSNEEAQEEILQVSYKEVQEEILQVSYKEVQEEILQVCNQEAQEAKTQYEQKNESDIVDEQEQEGSEIEELIEDVGELLDYAFQLKQEGRTRKSLNIYKKAIANGIGDDLLIWVIIDICALYKELGEIAQAKRFLNDIGDKYKYIITSDVIYEIEKNLN